MLCLSFNTLYASFLHYKGTVKGESGSPLEFANVTLMSQNDSTLIEGTVTDATGEFVVSGCDTRVFLRISAMGFEEKLIDNPKSDLGDIILTPTSYMLGEIVVTATRPMAKLKGDAVHVPIAGTYLANTGTAFELLGKMPFVLQVGEKFEVLGKGSPLIYINGRQIRDMSELDQLASSQIKNVDIVTNSGAKYASNVNAVIRITTIAPVGEGFSFSDRTTVGYKHYAYLFEQVNMNYRKNGFDLYAMLNYENYRERPRFNNFTIQFLPEATVTQNSTGKDFAKYPVYQGKIGLNYNKGEQSIGIYYDFSYRPSTADSYSFTSRLLNDNKDDELIYTGNISRHNRQHTLSAYYSSNIGKWQFAANFDALWQINDRQTAEYEISTINPNRNFITDNSVTNRLIAGSLNASFHIWFGDLTFGTEITNIHRTDLYSGNADYITDNDTKIDETTAAFFTETSQRLGLVTVSAGFRWEYTDSKYYLFSQRQNDQSRRYHNLVPSVSVQIPIGKVAASLSYMRKTSRPVFGQLSGAVRYLDRYCYESGNPDLRPIYRDYVGLTASWQDIVVEMEYLSTKNYFMWQTQPYPEYPDATLLKIENMPRYNTYGIYLNYSPCFFTIWRPTFMAGIQAQDFKIHHNNTDVKMNNPLAVFRFNNAIHLPWDIWLNLDFSIKTSGDSENIHVKSRRNCDLGLYKSFLNDKWSVKIQLNDLFNTDREEFITYDALTRTVAKKIYDTRDVSITLRYNFNSITSRYRGKGAGNNDKHRL